MNLHVRVVTHTIPYAFWIALTAMVVLTVKQSVFVTNSLFQRQPSITVCTCNILNSFFWVFRQMRTCGLGFCPKRLHIIAQGKRSATLGLRHQQEPVLPCRGCRADPLPFRRAVTYS